MLNNLLSAINFNFRLLMFQEIIIDQESKSLRYGMEKQQDVGRLIKCKNYLELPIMY